MSDEARSPIAPERCTTAGSRPSKRKEGCLVRRLAQGFEVNLLWDLLEGLL
jgi:hypothetical protein